MESFQESIEQMLWPERRKKDELFAKDDGPGVGIIDRFTVDSYVEVPESYLPPPVRSLVGIGRRLFPFVGGYGNSLKIGPFPKGSPVGLVTNMDFLGSDLPESQRKAHKERVTALLKHAKSAVKRNKDLPSILNELTDDMLAICKCKDFVVNKGHYFGTSYFTEEPGLSDSDKNGRFDHLVVIADQYVAGPYAEGNYEISLPITAAMIERMKPEYRLSFEPRPPVK